MSWCRVSRLSLSVFLSWLSVDVSILPRISRPAISGRAVVFATTATRDLEWRLTYRDVCLLVWLRGQIVRISSGEKPGKGGGGDEAEIVVSFPVCVYPKGSVVRCGSWDVRITPLQDSTAGVGGGLVSSRLCCGGQGLSGSNFEGSPGFSTISDKGTEGAT